MAGGYINGGFNIGRSMFPVPFGSFPIILTFTDDGTIYALTFDDGGTETVLTL